MGQAGTWHPSWWNEEHHGSAWGRVKEALKRDWEQTKHDVKAGGSELRQDVGDTLSQATGKEPVPPPTQANPPESDETWKDVEAPLGYGVAARQQYGTQHTAWSGDLESQLERDWDATKAGRGWSDVKQYVRRGYEHRGS